MSDRVWRRTVAPISAPTAAHGQPGMFCGEPSRQASACSLASTRARVCPGRGRLLGRCLSLMILGRGWSRCWPMLAVRTWVLGSDHERALRQAATAAIELTAAQLVPTGGERAEQTGAGGQRGIPRARAGLLRQEPAPAGRTGGSGDRPTIARWQLRWLSTSNMITPDAVIAILRDPALAAGDFFPFPRSPGHVNHYASRTNEANNSPQHSL